MLELRVIDISKNKYENLFKHPFKFLPNQGDWIEMDIEDKGTVYEVIKVLHSSKGLDSDIYVKFVGLTPVALQSLVQKGDNP